jgi:hypothetical protein
VTILAEHPIAPAAVVDIAALAAEVEAFITHPVPYELGDGRAQLRGDVRTTALASLLGSLTDLIESSRVTTDAVIDAIRMAIQTGTGTQQQYLAGRRADG